MPRPFLYDSFSYLVMMIKNGMDYWDTYDSIYYFGTTFDPPTLARTINDFDLTPEMVQRLTDQLCSAVEDGRVFWRLTGQNADALNRTRFKNMLRCARSLNSDIPLWETTRHPDAFWNIPAMRDFLGSSVTYANRV